MYLLLWEAVEKIQTSLHLDKSGIRMIVKENHKKNLFAYLFVVFCLMVMLIVGYYISRGENYIDIIIFTLLIIPMSIYLLYKSSYVTKTIYINNKSISMKLFPIIKIEMDWGKIEYIQICTVRERTNYTYKDFDAIVCSTIPIKMKEVPEGMYYKNVVLYDWISLHHKKVLGIYLNDLKPGQYEEFWSYVPERLKGNFKPKEEIVDN